MAASPRDMRAALHRARLRVTRGLRVAYNPRTDGKPDPGEVVWAWVPYEEDASQGKDRPVLLIGRDRRRPEPHRRSWRRVRRCLRGHMKQGGQR